MCCLLLAAPALTAPVLGLGQNFTGGTLGIEVFERPPDSNGAVGPAHFVELINGRFSVYNKTDAVRVMSISDLTFWSRAGLTIPSNWIVSDPRLIYDPTVQRWFATQIDDDPTGSINTNRFLLAVSVTADPMGPWKGVAFAGDPSALYFADFPTLGLDAQGVYLSGDMFDAQDNGVGASFFSIPKADLLGSPPSLARLSSFGIMSYSERGDVLQPAVALDGSSNANILAAGHLGLDLLPHFTFKASHVIGPGAASATLSDP